MKNKTYEAIYRAHTNIALIKYWGKRNQELYLPMTSSLSLTLESLYTDTAIKFDANLAHDTFSLDGKLQDDKETEKVSKFVDLFREYSDIKLPVAIESVNHVPTAAGLASSASAFAALASAINAALGLELSPEVLSTFARQGSGSSTRSLFGGLAIWHKGDGDDSASSYAEQIDDATFDIGMLIVVVNNQKKKISSRIGMQHTIETSPFYKFWPEEVEKDLALMLPAIEERNIDKIGEIAEHNAMKMHSTMIASNPSFNYFEAKSLRAIELVQQMRADGLSAYYTMDAGPNVKIICPYSQIDQIKTYLKDDFSDDQLIASRPGTAPYAINKLNQPLEMPYE
ncbi:diphosphomevalonate decarboxylase [Aerococcaceae bacterium DSM 111022]|nr:diphosphomevalonate decarboxylase [Aerococcaceae bacterium DSM 111022]